MTTLPTVKITEIDVYAWIIILLLYLIWIRLKKEGGVIVDSSESPAGE